MDDNTKLTEIDVTSEPSHPAKGVKLANYLIVSFLIIIAIGLGIFLNWSLANTSVLEVKNSPFPARVVADPSGQTGGIVFLKAEYCKNQDIDGQLRLSYVSKSREVFLPIVPERSPKGCDNKEIPVIIPLNLLRDQYKIKFHVTYDINPLKQNITDDFESQPVTIGTGVTDAPN